MSFFGFDLRGERVGKMERGGVKISKKELEGVRGGKKKRGRTRGGPRRRKGLLREGENPFRLGFGLKEVSKRRRKDNTEKVSGEKAP